MQLIYIVIFWILFGFLTAYIAKRRGRDPLIWFPLGILFGFMGVLLALILPKQQKKMHVPPPLLRPRRSDVWLKLWYYLDPTHQQQGPFDFPELAKLRKNKHISEGSFIWGEGMKEWTRLSELPDLIQELDQA